MRLSTWRLLGAAHLLVAALLACQTAAAQDCPQCAADAASGACGGEQSPCFTPLGPCQGKACYGYRPFTEASQPDLFYNFYVPNNLGSAAAAYPAPYPTPNIVGHTYYTYQPLMPHEFLYHHHRTYHQYYNGGMGLNRTSVHWYGQPIHTAFKGTIKALRLPH